MKMVYVHNHNNTQKSAIYYEDSRGNVRGVSFEDDKNLTPKEKKFLRDGKKNFERVFLQTIGKENKKRRTI